MIHMNKSTTFAGSVPDVRAAQTTAAVATENAVRKEGEGGELSANVTLISVAKGGKEGDDVTPFTAFTPITLTNADFLAEIFTDLSEGAHPIIAAKVGDPTALKGFMPQDAVHVDRVCRPDLNTYFNCASVYPGEDGQIAARLEYAAAYHAVVLDDVGTKVDRTLLGGITPTWELETSPGNFQIGFKLSPAIRDGAEVKRLQDMLKAAGLTDTGALGMVRWVRLPQGVNGKAKYQRDGKPFTCQLHGWNPDITYSANALIAALGLKKLAAQPEGKMPFRPASRTMPLTGLNREVYLPAADELPVISAFKEAGLYKRDIGSGKHDVTCPWVDEHTDALDSGTAYFEPSGDYPSGGFKCQHSHGGQYHIGEVLKHFDLSSREARNRPVIRVSPGGIHDQIQAAEKVLSLQGDVYQSSGMIVRVFYDEMAHDRRIQPLTDAELTMHLSKLCAWERINADGKWVPCDVPTRVITTLSKKADYDFLPFLHGIVRQPSYRKGDGTLLTQPGYDPASKKLAVFDTSAFPAIGHTREDAEKALVLMRELLSEFRFADPVDEAAALCAMLTAVARPSLDVAPAFHVKAPASGSGKSYLCDVIGRFTGDGQPFRMSYPVKNEEATKQVMAALLSAPAVLEWDDMNTDWLPHGSINRMLTSPVLTDRILGMSKTATVSTNTLVLGSGNNVGPIRDLCRRVLTISINSRTEMPGTIVYNGDPVAKVRAERGRYVMAALTIIEAWKAAERPRTSLPPIASYGDWADHCRHPLVWLGLPDPATALLAQMRDDPEAEEFGAMLAIWHRKFGEKAMTLRRLLECNNHDDSLIEAIQDLPVLDGGRINNSKLGWYFKKRVERIFGGFVLQKADCAERNAWTVVKVEKGEPSLPPLEQPSAATELF
jgi:hypothetical protein